MKSARTRILVEIALSVALAAVLNMLKIFHMPQGGTVSLGMLPLIVLAIRHGAGVGILGGLLYGVIDFFVDPFPPVHWIQYLLDYPVAYGAVGLAGIGAGAWRRAVERGQAIAGVWKAVLPATAVGIAGRYLAHLISGAVFFGMYAPEGQPIWVYSALYNLYVPISGVLCMIAGAAVLPALARVSTPDTPAASGA